MSRELTGTMETIGGRPVLRFERRLAHPPEKVWKAITDPAELAHWFPATVDTELKVGAPIRFQMDEIDDTFGEIVELDPPKLFVIRWDGDMLRWEIVPEGSGCRLFFSHTLSGSATWGDARFGAQHAAGWDGCLDMLAGRLDGVAVDDSMDDWFERNERYVEEFGLAEGEVLDHPDGRLVRFERVLVRPIEEAWATLTSGTALDATPASSTAGDGTTADGTAGGGTAASGTANEGVDAGTEGKGSGGGVTAGSPPPPRATIGIVPPGPVSTVEPGRSLEYPWRDEAGNDAGRVRWELTPQDFGCGLVLTQTVPELLTDRLPELLATWQVHIEELIAALHDVTRPWPADRVASLTERYGQRQH